MNYETIELKTKRLVIKKGEKEDFLKVYEYDFSSLQNVDDVFKLEKQDKNKIESWFKGGIKKYYSKIKKAHMFDWIIYIDGKAIGNVLTEDEEDKKSINLSFNIHPNYWGKGYMPEALEMIINYLYSLGYDNIICSYLDGNTKAKRTLSKLGFKPYKIEKDFIKSSNCNLIDLYKTILTKEDWFSRTTKINPLKGSL